MKLLYKKEVPESAFNIDDFDSWSKNSLPLGNGLFGVCELSTSKKERLQITNNSLANPHHKSLDEEHKSNNYGVISFCDLLFDFNHLQTSDFKRELNLDNATSLVSYKSNQTSIKREIFTSHKDNVLVIRIKSNEPISFVGEVKVPFVNDYCRIEGDGYARTNRFLSFDKGIMFEGNLSYYNIDYCGLLKIKSCDGYVSIKNNTLKISNSKETIFVFSCLTNYVLCKETFLIENPKEKLPKNHNLKNELISVVDNACSLTYLKLYRRHYEDYHPLYGAVDINFGKQSSIIPTDELLAKYKNKKHSPYLEALLFQYGRYLLICSSRNNGLPANLQGIWSAYDSSPWSDGYWHNINVQMNYWLTGPANLSECFKAYINYAKCYLPLAKRKADEYIALYMPDKYEDNNNGWIIGTGGWPYDIQGLTRITHSGPGTGAFTALLFYEHYMFTKDEEFLKKVAYPIMYEMSIFLYKCLRQYDDKYLVEQSASPENIIKGGKWNDYYITKGCAFDQQMVYECLSKTIELSKIINSGNYYISKFEEVVSKLDPVLIGKDGQIKEYREEERYDDFGEPHHRHISQLVGLYPGNVISTKKEWIDASKITLNLRGDKSTGWAAAHRLCLWSRVKDVKRTNDLIHSFINENLLDNLWCSHPPFQIDGNFGYVAGICESLLQSQNGYIELIPCPIRKHITFKGLKVRGNFIVDCKYDGKLISSSIKSLSGGKLKILNKNYWYSINNGQHFYCNDSFINIDTNTGDVVSLGTKQSI